MPGSRRRSRVGGKTPCSSEVHERRPQRRRRRSKRCVDPDGLEVEGGAVQGPLVRDGEAEGKLSRGRDEPWSEGETEVHVDVDAAEDDRMRDRDLRQCAEEEERECARL